MKDFSFSDYGSASALVWLRVKITSHWIDKLKYIEREHLIRNDTLYYPIKYHLTAPFVGRSSNIRRITMYAPGDDVALVHSEFMRVCFDRKTRRSTPIPVDFKQRMTNALARRGDTNIRPSTPKLPEHCTTFFTESMLTTAEHQDENMHVHYKTYLFFAIQCLKQAVVTHGGSHCGVVDSGEELIIYDYFMSFEQESVAGDSLTCCLMKSQSEPGLVHALIHSAERRVSYIRMDTHSFREDTPPQSYL